MDKITQEKVKDSCLKLVEHCLSESKNNLKLTLKGVVLKKEKLGDWEIIIKRKNI